MLLEFMSRTLKSCNYGVLMSIGEVTRAQAYPSHFKMVLWDADHVLSYIPYLTLPYLTYRVTHC